MNGQPETMSWGMLFLALWPLWVAYGVLALVALVGAIQGRRI